MNVYVKDVLDLLEREGPLSTVDVVRFFPGAEHRQVARVLSDLRRRLTKAVYISGWTHAAEPGEKFYPRAIYSIGSLPDVRKPRALTRTEVDRRYRIKCRARLPKRVPNSVWQLGAAR